MDFIMENYTGAINTSNHFNISQNTTEDSDKLGRCVLPLAHGIPIATINCILVFIGTFGNFLVIFAVLNTPKLRHKISNFLLLSLAFADLLVTMCAQPLNVISVSFKTIAHYCVRKIDFAYDIVGNFSCFCSIFHLAAISIDRAFVVRKPHQHHSMMKKFGLKWMLCICWGIATVFVCLRVPFPSTLMLSIILILLNYAIIIVAYAVTICQVSKQVPRNGPVTTIPPVSKYSQREKRVTRAIGIVIVFFALCWFPVLGYYISVENALLRDLGSVTYMWVRTLALSNSSINFIVYSWRIDHFRTAYFRIIRRILQLKPKQQGAPKVSMSTLQIYKNSETPDCNERTSRIIEDKSQNNEALGMQMERACSDDKEVQKGASVQMLAITGRITCPSEEKTKK